MYRENKKIKIQYKNKTGYFEIKENSNFEDLKDFV